MNNNLLKENVLNNLVSNEIDKLMLNTIYPDNMQEIVYKKVHDDQQGYGAEYLYVLHEEYTKIFKESKDKIIQFLRRNFSKMHNLYDMYDLSCLVLKLDTSESFAYNYVDKYLEYKYRISEVENLIYTLEMIEQQMN